MTEHFLSRAEFAERIGVKPGTLGRYNLPEPDATIGDVRGWLPETVDRWHAGRPGKGGRKPSTRGSTKRPEAPSA